ncbi:hypothetical protein [Pseudothauera lacus]|uniref:hypothetical protein n=1 Tax=Pseudothauera lacus TaxID=2136175 RepID=UPI0011B1F600|nr:hypothetical protein [Pseudothauera lacus]
MKTITIILTGEAGTGWNYAVLTSGKPLPAEDPQYLPSAARALQGALLQLQASMRGSSPAQTEAGNPNLGGPLGHTSNA